MHRIQFRWKSKIKVTERESGKVQGGDVGKGMIVVTRRPCTTAREGLMAKSTWITCSENSTQILTTRSNSKGRKWEEGGRDRTLEHQKNDWQLRHEKLSN